MTDFRQIERVKPHHSAAKPPALTDDMTAADLVRTLERLSFTGSDKVIARPATCLVSLDRGVRDYLLRAIRPR